MTKRMRWLAGVGVVAGLMLGAPGPAFAWGPEGHDIVAAVALARLSPAQQAKFNAIWTAGKAGLVVDYVDDTGKAQHCSAGTLGQLANWADCVRYGGEFKGTYDSHFDDIPYCPKPPAPPPPLASYCGPTVPCATKALPGYIAQLKAASTSPRDRAVALAMIVHMVGDLHQPLHTIDNGDKGGNGVQVDETPAAGAAAFHTSLHKVWDGDLVKAAMGPEAAGIAATKALADAHAADWGKGDASAWAAESHAVAVRAYDALSPAIACGASGSTHRPVDPAYLDKFSPDVRQQLARASVRLSVVLKAALS